MTGLAAGGGSMAGVSARRSSAWANTAAERSAAVTTRRVSLGRRVLLLLVIAVCLGAWLPGAASANPYTVHVCDSATGYQVNSISYAATGSNAAFSTCPTDGGGHRVGLNLHAPAPQAPSVVYTGPNTFSYAQFDAPAGTDTRGLAMDAGGRGNDQGFDYAHLYATTDHFATLNHLWTMTACGTSLAAGCVGHYTASWGPGMNA